MLHHEGEIARRRRVNLSDVSFVEIVIWRVPLPLKGSEHEFKYSLVYIVNERCVLRYDNEAGKGDHVHREDREFPYAFTTIEELLSDFMSDVETLER